MPESSRIATFEPLFDICLDDLLAAFGLMPLRNVMVRAMLRPAVRRFVRIVREFDDRVASVGLSVSSEWLLQRVAGGLQVTGHSVIPSHGPLLVLANHPGMTDTAALFASLRTRADLLVIAQDRPFLRALPHTAASLILVADEGPTRARGIRAGIEHLRCGGALLTFPAGTIEPDPFAAGARPAVNALQTWSTSFALLARAAPATCIVTAIVSHVVSAQALRHPLTRLRRGVADQEKLAAALQILWPRYQRTKARVTFGSPTTMDKMDPAELRSVIISRATALIEASAVDRLL